MFMVNHLAGFSARVPDPVLITKEANTYNTSGLTTYTFSSQALGTPHPDRQIAITIYGGALTRTVSSVTVAGVSATQAVHLQDSSVTGAIYVASVPTGTTGDVVVTFSAGQSFCGIGVYSVQNARTTLFDTATDIDDDPSTNINVAANGALIASVGATTSSSAPSGWSGVTQDWTAFEDANHGYSGASQNFRGQLTARTVSVNTNAAPGQVCLTVASFQPLP